MQALLPTAIGAWEAAGLDLADVRKLESVPVEVSNLGTIALGLEADGVVTINQTAEGFNWYVNAGSGSSSQRFGSVGVNGELLASPGSAAANDVDLLTVLEHELGHVLGLPDNDRAGDLMDITLGLGVRRTPSRRGPGADRSDVGHRRLVLPQSVLPSSNRPVTSATVDAAAGVNREPGLMHTAMIKQ